MSRTLSTLLKSGIRINDAIDITIGTMGNVIVDEYMMQAKESILSGQPFSAPLKKSGFFPIIVLQMVSIGEKTGSLDSMLEKVADFYEEEVEQTAEQLTSLLEPIVIVVLGGMIGTLVVAMFLPIFNLGNAFG
jgi:type IV pilus assembly protein PilC